MEKMRLQNINKKKEVIEVKRKGEYSWAMVVRKLKSQHELGRLKN